MCNAEFSDQSWALQVQGTELLLYYSLIYYTYFFSNLFVQIKSKHPYGLGKVNVIYSHYRGHIKFMRVDCA